MTANTSTGEAGQQKQLSTAASSSSTSTSWTATAQQHQQRQGAYQGKEQRDLQADPSTLSLPPKSSAAESAAVVGSSSSEALGDDEMKDDPISTATNEAAATASAIFTSQDQDQKPEDRLDVEAAEAARTVELAVAPAGTHTDADADAADDRKEEPGALDFDAAADGSTSKDDLVTNRSRHAASVIAATTSDNVKAEAASPSPQAQSDDGESAGDVAALDVRKPSSPSAPSGHDDDGGEDDAYVVKAALSQEQEGSGDETDSTRASPEDATKQSAEAPVDAAVAGRPIASPDDIRESKADVPVQDTSSQLAASMVTLISPKPAPEQDKPSARTRDAQASTSTPARSARSGVSGLPRTSSSSAKPSAASLFRKSTPAGRSMRSVSTPTTSLASGGGSAARSPPDSLGRSSGRQAPSTVSPPSSRLLVTPLRPHHTGTPGGSSRANLAPAPIRPQHTGTPTKVIERSPLYAPTAASLAKARDRASAAESPSSRSTSSPVRTSKAASKENAGQQQQQQASRADSPQSLRTRKSSSSSSSRLTQPIASFRAKAPQQQQPSQPSD